MKSSRRFRIQNGAADNMNVFFVSLGCDKNLTDSEQMLGIMARGGCRITDDETAADVIVINTCCFINDAKEESIQSILDMAELKKSGKCKALIVTGCLAQRYSEEIREEIPEVDAVLGTASYDRIMEVTREVLRGKKEQILDPLDRIPASGERLLTTGGHYAYLKIAEGCNKFCTYCIIPHIRGRYRSYPLEQLVNEAVRLAEEGVKELILVAQETTMYGVDLYGKKSLHLLIRELCKIEGLKWIRLLYCYPEEIYGDLIAVMREEEKFCHYLDIPIQHIDDEILKRMGRKTDGESLRRIIQTLREEIPDIVLRTTLISGFPGETPGQHQKLLDFVDETEFDRLGVFAYSPEEGTPAAEMPDQIDPDVCEQRRDEIMQLQQEVCFDLAAERTGQILTVMVEGYLYEDGVYVCRTYADAPGVDGMLFLQTQSALMSGDFVSVSVTGSNGYDLIGEEIEL